MKRWRAARERTMRENPDGDGGGGSVGDDGGGGGDGDEYGGGGGNANGGCGCTKGDCTADRSDEVGAAGDNAFSDSAIPAMDAATAWGHHVHGAREFSFGW